jgi:carbonic anhydrase/acetyltransferase-like protein (isoleucine patch superfamily)
MPFIEINGEKPIFHENTFIAENAQIIGKVTIKEGASIWFNCVLRGDMDRIIIGQHTNIQDGVIIHNDPGIPTIVGDYVTVGHGAILHACTIEDKVLIGMGAIILDGAEIGEGAIVAAGAVVTPNTKVPANTLVVGKPAKLVKSLDIKEQEARIKHALRYQKIWQELYKNKEDL